MRPLSAALAILLTTGCTGGMRPATGSAALAPADAAELKTAALHGARLEISRATGNGPAAYGLYLDTLVGPTEAAYLSSPTHPREWLEAMVATHLVDGLFGVGPESLVPHSYGIAIEIGDPFPAGHDTLEVAYTWCFRPIPASSRQAGRAASWRDAFVKADTGWTRVRHAPAVFISACLP